MWVPDAPKIEAVQQANQPKKKKKIRFRLLKKLYDKSKGNMT